MIVPSGCGSAGGGLLSGPMLVCDRASDADRIRSLRQGQVGEQPPERSRNAPTVFSLRVYKQRKPIKCCINR